MNILLWIVLIIVGIAALPSALQIVGELWQIFLEEVWDPFWED
jgi:hypothetical protein